MDLEKETLKKIRELIVFTALLIVCLWKYENVLAVVRYVFRILLPFILGGAIAFILNVPMRFFENKVYDKMKKHVRVVSLVSVLVCAVGIISTVLFVLIPQLGMTFSKVGNSVQKFYPHAQEWIIEKSGGNKDIAAFLNGMKLDWNEIMSTGLSFFSSGAGTLLDSTITAAKGIISSVSTFFISFVFAIYILMQKEKLSVQMKKVLFAFVRRGRAEAVLEICSLTYKIFSGFLTGQCLESIILGGMFVLAMVIFRFPYALLIGIIIGFTALIPIFGAFIGCGIGAFLIFIEDPWKALMFIVLFLVMQQIEGNFIYPRVVGGSVGLPSIWVLAAVSVGGSLMGVVGMLVFIPLVSVIYALFREVVYIKLRQQGISPEDIEGTCAAENAEGTERENVRQE